jgi:heptosyltransferase-2
MKILVRAPNWIGDAVMATPALFSLRRRFPGTEIALLAKPSIAALFEADPNIDRCVVYERPGRHEGFGGLFRLILTLRKMRFHLAILFQNAFEAALIAVASEIPQRVGYDRDGRGFLLTHPCANPPKHQRDAYLRLVERVGCDIETPPPTLTVTQKERESVGTLYGVTEDDLWVGINPGAAYGPAKRWSPDRFAAVADEMVRRFGVRIVILGSLAEREIAETVRRQMKAQATQLAGRTTVREMMAILSRCRLLVTNDSGPMHVAAALGVPVVAVFGPTDSTATSPGGAGGGEHRIVHRPVECSPCTHRVCPIDHRCMERITVESVLAAAQASWIGLDAPRSALAVSRIG